ncbi:uncharacterized protein LOC121267170 [Juglans microcarpa x Juglans regia]|uniref:uncharacterized protein LOC121267170 n=1 Tax=Juglans microcarpa x Juglans regia TaxID=2249226 RepID=UPI001B7EE10D|nr:uncharacterized protein LOC121267170 [Juglans microcarpa x Juglans regia]
MKEALCEWCTYEDEDVGHAICYCPFVRQSWKHYFPDLLTDDVKLDIMQIVLKVLSQGKHEDLDQFFLIAWNLWNKRNQKIFVNKVLTTNQVIEHALSLAKDHKEARVHKQTRKLSSCYWQAPSQNALKLNVDEAIFATLNRSGVGFILRSSSSKVIMAASMKENGANDSMEIELLAILRGLQICIPMGIDELIIESDLLLIVNELIGAGEPRVIWFMR